VAFPAGCASELKGPLIGGAGCGSRRRLRNQPVGMSSCSSGGAVRRIKDQLAEVSGRLSLVRIEGTCSHDTNKVPRFQHEPVWGVAVGHQLVERLEPNGFFWRLWRRTGSNTVWTVWSLGGQHAACVRVGGVATSHRSDESHKPHSCCPPLSYRARGRAGARARRRSRLATAARPY